MSNSGELLARVVEESIQGSQAEYFLEPIVLTENGKPVGSIRDGDTVIFTCRRGEREVQLTRAFVDPAFDEFPTANFSRLTFVTMTRYHEMFKDLPAAFPPMKGQKETLGELISHHKLQQLRVAESEKFNHVTFFLNGGINQPFPHEDHICIPSLKGIPFDQVPEMRSAQVTKAAVEGMQKGSYSFIAVNFANGDVIGHINNFQAKVQCAEALDQCLGKVLHTAQEKDFVVIITADHGLFEMAMGLNGSPNLHHTQNLVPFVIVEPRGEKKYDLLGNGSLRDVSPTILDIMGLPQPLAMTGTSLLHQDHQPIKRNHRVLLVIMDGWGLGPNNETNPIFVARTPIWDEMIRLRSSTALQASGEAVGLLPGKPGNSEAGHMNIGAGRVVLQDDVRIAQALENNSFERNPIFQKALDDALQKNGALHLITILSERSSHGSLRYPLALLRLAKKKGVRRAFVHTIFNRPYLTEETAPKLLRKLAQDMGAIGIGEIVTGIGRGFALDRDGDYQKTKLAYDAFVFGRGKSVPNDSTPQLARIEGL
jgi:2,3-bisphosphoglycerate-independent phosphoglycerate mutase